MSFQEVLMQIFTFCIREHDVSCAHVTCVLHTLGSKNPIKCASVFEVIYTKCKPYY